MPEASPDLAVRPEILVLDASVQLLIAALPSAAREGNLFVGQGQQFTHVYKAFPRGPIWCQVRLRNSDFTETVSGDIYLFDETGQVFAEFGDVRYGRLSQTMLQRVARRQERLTPKFKQSSLTREALLAAPPDQRYRLLETYLRDVVGQVLGLSSEQLDEAQSLVMMLDSLMAVELKQRIESHLGVELPLARLLGGDSLAEMAAFLSNQLTSVATMGMPGRDARADAGLEQTNLVSETPVASHSTKMTVDELRAEAVLDPDIRPEGAPREWGSEPRNILLTGATGFIGAFLLDELLRQTSATIYCLVRAPDAVSAKDRIKQNLESYLLWDETLNARVIPVVGDLAQPRLGLSAEQFNSLAREMDVIWHCGALVKWTYPYAALKAPNVLGTQEVLRLACQHRTKPVHFISTVGVFSSPDYPSEVVRESEPLESSGPLTVGYAQSKWVAEKLVRIAGERGLPVTIYRPNTGGHSQTGVFNPNDHLPLLIKGCVQLGYLPEDLGLTVQSAPIDYVSKAMVYLAQQPSAVGQTFHLVNPSPLRWPEVVEQIRGMGYVLPTLPYSQWATELADQIKGSSQRMTEAGGRRTKDERRRTNDNALYALSPFLSDSARDNNQLPVFDCENVLKTLAGSSLNCPPPDELFRVYFTQFVSSGFLNAPGSAVLSPS
jgi:thioester reductase-like protein